LRAVNGGVSKAGPEGRPQAVSVSQLSWHTEIGSNAKPPFLPCDLQAFATVTA